MIWTSVLFGSASPAYELFYVFSLHLFVLKLPYVDLKAVVFDFQRFSIEK